MSPEERRKAFTEAYNALVQHYGFAIVTWQEPRQLGPVVQVEVKTDIQPVQGWTEPQEPLMQELPGVLLTDDGKPKVE